MRKRHAALLVLFSSFHLQVEARTRAADAQPPASSCAVSDEAEFATTKTHAVQVGGGALYVAARERRYLDALREHLGLQIGQG